MGQPPYQGQYQTYTSAVPPVRPSKKGNHKNAILLSIILGFILVAVVALIILGSYMIEKGADSRDRDSNGLGSSQNRTREEAILDEYESEYSEEFSEPEESDVHTSADSYSHYSEDVTQRNWEEEGQDAAYSYYTGPYNALRDDLDYEISFTEETYSSADGIAFLCIEYPQVETGEEWQDYINAVLYYEYEYYRGLYEESFKPHITSDEDTYYCIADSYVTYMDEKILSVVFKEEIYMELQAETFEAVNLFCLNFDLETGTLLENTEILRMDEAFAIDFRQREVDENGDEALTYYTDQEILDMLTDDGYLVMFYTPMGMEVGLNLEDRVVYVMYADYEKYLNSF